MSDEVSWYREYFKETYDTWIAVAGRVGVRDHSARHDIVQQVLKELWECRERIAADRRVLDAFMYKRVKNRVIDRWKAAERRPEVPVGEFLGELQPVGVPDTRAYSDGDWAETIDAKKWLVDLVNSLDERDRGHVILVALGVPPQVRAELLGITEGNERVRWHRLRKRLAALIEKPETEGQGTAE
ncbi:RNA polymerase sigma factor [Streptomyces sp. NPDC102462]|uniref:RNA polymerase sigma factor n=1 Tax=Streptomyces sp. NPDC102462 TaxID=3366178 RepID=UPI00380B8B47